MDGIVAALIGRLGQDAELKYLDTGTAALKLSLAVCDAKAAERGDPPQWVRCTVWGARAEELGESLKKGAEVYVEGRLRLSRWTMQDGAERSGLEVSAFKCEPLGQIGRRRPPPRVVAGAGKVA